MSLNKFSNTAIGQTIDLQIGCDELKANNVVSDNLDVSTINGSPYPPSGGGVQNPLTADLKLDGFRIIEELASLSPSLNIEQLDPTKEIKLGIGGSALRLQQNAFNGIKLTELDPLRQIQIGTFDGGSDSNLRTLATSTQFDKNIEMNANINDNSGGLNTIGNGALFWGDVRSTKLTGDGIYEKASGSQNLVLNVGNTQSLKNVDMNANDTINQNNIVMVDNARIDNTNNGFSLRNNRDLNGDNIYIAPSENIFYKNINLQNNVDITFPFANNSIGGPITGRLNNLWVNFINGLSPYGGVFSGTAPSLLNNPSVGGAVEVSLLPTSFVGSVSVPANTFEISSYHLVLAGSIGANNGDTLTLRLKAGATSTIILATLIVPLSNASGSFECEVDFQLRNIGGAGVADICSNFDFTYNTSGGGGAFVGERGVFQNNTTFDTTTLNTLEITAQFSSTNVANNLQSEVQRLTRTY